MNLIGRIIRSLILGPAYFKHLYLICRSKNWDNNTIEKYYLSKKQTAPYTITTKKDIKSNPTDFLKNSPFIPLVKVQTGGTTGTPFSFYQDKIFTRQKERAYIFDIWGRIGYKPFDFRIVVRGNILKKEIKFNWFENCLIISQNYFKNSNKEELLRIFSKSSYFLHVYPSTLFFLVNFFGENSFRSFPIKGVFAGSEAFPVNQIEWFNSKFNIPIAHWYGHSEYAILGRYCDHCKEFHFYPTYGKLSLVNKENTQYIIATSFNKFGTQFVNYLTEDLALESITKCRIDDFPKVRKITGRNQEFLLKKNKTKVPFGPLLFGIHSKFWDSILELQFIQNEPGKLKVLYSPTMKNMDGIFKKTILERFKDFELNFQKVLSIEKTSSGKHRYFLQKIKEF